jgi:CDP-6-deoxy-D-xylo-4-hexulose-3-dehydrase
LARELEKNLIGNRMLFGGNLLRQPAFVELQRDDPFAVRVIGSMVGSDEIMANTLFLGTYPGLTPEMLTREVEVIAIFLRQQAP